MYLKHSHHSPQTKVFVPLRTVLCLPQTASADMARFIEIVMGVGIAAGTVIEDFGTGGVGIADDLASFLIAQKLILGY